MFILSRIKVITSGVHWSYVDSSYRLWQVTKQHKVKVNFKTCEFLTNNKSQTDYLFIDDSGITLFSRYKYLQA